MDIDLNDYVAGGYFITKYCPVGSWDENSERLLPEQVITLSSCFRKYSLGAVWEGGFEQLTENALTLGVAEEALDEFADWAHYLHKDFGHPDVFYTLDAARSFISRFFTSQSDLILIGIALPREMVSSFLVGNPEKIMVAQPGEDYQLKENLSPEEQYGVNHVLLQNEALASGGQALGFEIVGWEYWNFRCSWLCAEIEREMYELHGMRPNEHGLIGSYKDAKKVYDWIAEDDQQGGRAEPMPYYPWLICRYPFSSG